MYIGMYVDDIVLAARTDEELQPVKSDLAKEFDIKNTGKLGYFVGMSIIQDKDYMKISLDWSTGIYRECIDQVQYAKL